MKMLYLLIQRYGIKTIVIIASLVIVIISGLITIVSLYIALGKFVLSGLLISTIVPGLIAPPQIYFFLYSIVKQKRVEDELRELNASMEEIIEKRTEKLELALKEKETLIYEIHHRVKNNLQIVISLMKLKSRDFLDKRDMEMCRDIEEKIRAMSLVHEQLYGEKNYTNIELKEFLNRLINNVLSSYELSRNIHIVQDNDDISLDLGVAIPLSIIITEILTNSIKHAFPGGQEGTVHISIKRKDGHHILAEMWDNGVGFKKNTEEGMGCKIIHALVSQLDGDMEITTQNGVHYSITFPC
jgi:two-component sensor histidine kinase